jgi:hypothetical protein
VPWRPAKDCSASVNSVLSTRRSVNSVLSEDCPLSGKNNINLIKAGIFDEINDQVSGREAEVPRGSLRFPEVPWWAGTPEVLPGPLQVVWRCALGQWCPGRLAYINN